MRVLCPYTRAGENGIERGLHPLCEHALALYAPDAEMVYLGTHHEAYYEYLQEAWRAGEAFLLVEQDIELRAGIVDELAACPEPWCTVPYGIGWPPAPLEAGLGCTRFSAGLLAAVPDMIDRLPCRDWRRIDCELHPRLRTAGYEPHVHLPAVAHHHRYPAPGGPVCACGEDDCDARSEGLLAS